VVKVLETLKFDILGISMVAKRQKPDKQPPSNTFCP